MGWGVASCVSEEADKSIGMFASAAGKTTGRVCYMDTPALVQQFRTALYLVVIVLVIVLIIIVVMMFAGLENTAQEQS